jgi:hypothetical protein
MRQQAPPPARRAERGRDAIRRRLADSPWLTFVVVLAALTLAAGLIWFGVSSGKTTPDDAGKAGLQLLTVGIVGIAIARAFRWRDDRLERQRRLDEHRAKVIDDLIATYFRTKKARRILRAAGFDKDVTLTAAQSEIFNTQMEELDEARTTLERLARESRSDDRVFDGNQVLIQGWIREAENKLGKITRVWEEGAVEVVEGAEFRSIRKERDFQPLMEFLDHAEKEKGIKFIGDRIRWAEDRIAELRLR